MAVHRRALTVMVASLVAVIQATDWLQTAGVVMVSLYFHPSQLTQHYPPLLNFSQI